MPNQPGNKNKVVRIPDDLWADAKVVAQSAGEPLSAVLTRALINYVSDPPGRNSQNGTGRPCPACERIVGPIGGGGGTALARHHNTEGQWCT